MTWSGLQGAAEVGCGRATVSSLRCYARERVPNLADRRAHLSAGHRRTDRADGLSRVAGRAPPVRFDRTGRLGRASSTRTRGRPRSPAGPCIARGGTRTARTRTRRRSSSSRPTRGRTRRPVGIVPLMHRHEVEPGDMELRTTIRHQDGPALTARRPRRQGRVLRRLLPRRLRDAARGARRPARRRRRASPTTWPTAATRATRIRGTPWISAVSAAATRRPTPSRTRSGAARRTVAGR